MQIAEIMSRDVKTASPDQTIEHAAKMMAEYDIGAVPVAENDRLIGMVTDRDICLRAVAAGKAPGQCRIGDVMSPDVKYVFADQSTDDLARNMADLQMRRLPVVDRNKRLVGIVAMADLATRDGGNGRAGAALAGVSERVL